MCAALVVLLGAAACPYAGHYLIVDEPLQPADAIVVLAGSPAERWLEGVDLYREKLAPQVILSPGIVEPAEARVRAMGIRLPAGSTWPVTPCCSLACRRRRSRCCHRQVDNTADEAALTRSLLVQRGWTSIIVVTSKYHTRRTRFAFARELSGSGVRIQVRGSRYDEVSPDRWWTHRSDLRYVVSELQKLAAYRLGLGK